MDVGALFRIFTYTNSLMVWEFGRIQKCIRDNDPHALCIQNTYEHALFVHFNAKLGIPWLCSFSVHTTYPWVGLKRANIPANEIMYVPEPEHGRRVCSVLNDLEVMHKNAHNFFCSVRLPRNRR